MKERSWPSSPLTGTKQAALPIFFISPNWVQRHAGLVGQSCRFVPIKKPPYLPMLPSKNPHEPNLFLGTQPALGVLHFSIRVYLSIRGLKDQSDFRRFKPFKILFFLSSLP
jgi:hypothetical protein